MARPIDVAKNPPYKFICFSEISAFSHGVLDALDSSAAEALDFAVGFEVAADGGGDHPEAEEQVYTVFSLRA